MELISVADFYGEDTATVEITKNWYAGFYGQLKQREKGWEFSWYQVDWYETEENPTTNSHLGCSILVTEDYESKEEAMAEGRLLLVRFLIKGLEDLECDEQMSLVDLKAEY